jgi:hypothetical protein
MKAPHLRAFQFRKPDPVPDLYGGYLALIPCVALAVLMFAAPWVSGTELRMCTL